MMRRWIAIALACGVSGVFQAVHGVAYQGTVDLASVAFTMAVIGVEVLALAVLFDRIRRAEPMAGLPIVRGGALALGVGIALAFAAAAVPAGAFHRLPARIVAEIGLFDGLLGLGLWALAIAVPSGCFETSS
jgi:hypothetical protein